MSVYIKGMEMPSECWQCLFQDSGNCIVNKRAVDRAIINGQRSDNCPLIPVPDHGPLIDKDALEQDISDSVVFSGRENNPEIYGANKIINRIRHAPTVIPADKEEENVE